MQIAKLKKVTEQRNARKCKNSEQHVSMQNLKTPSSVRLKKYYATFYKFSNFVCGLSVWAKAILQIFQGTQFLFRT